MRVIVLQKGHKLDSSAAEDYGRRIYVLNNFVDPFDTEKLVNTFHRKLKQISFDPDNDIICLTGPSILLQLFLAVVGSIHKKIKILMFYAPDSKYKLRTLELQNGKRDEETV